MKKWFIGILAMLLAALLIPTLVMGANVVKVGAQITVAWDGVTAPVGSSIQYQMYYRTDASGTAVPAGVPSSLIQATVTFSLEGIYDIGVQAQRVTNGTVTTSSSISWSNDPTKVLAGNTFVNQYLADPAGPLNLRILPPLTSQKTP